MKRTLYFLALIFLFSGTVIGQDQKKIVRPEIKSATVFIHKAQLASTASTSLDAGTSEIILQGLPFSIDPQSIQVSGKGNITVQSVKYEENYLNPHEKSKELVLLEDSLKFYQFQIGSYKDFEDVMKKEEQMLIANQVIKGENEALDADDLEYFANFYRKRLLDIRFQILKNKRDIEQMQEGADRVQKQISSLTGSSKPTGIIRVMVSSNSKTNAQLDINYVVNNAAWHPVYDIRVKDSDSPVNFACKAMVYQNTGIDWKNVDLTLATTNPFISGNRPQLTPWYIRSYDPQKSRNNSKKIKHSSAEDINALRESEPSSVNYAVLADAVETSLAVKFKIQTPYSVASGNKGQAVDIQKLDLPAQYTHLTAPKISDAAYLVAMISGYEDKNLISGKANVYFDGTFVGETFLDMNTTEDTLQVSLGKDNHVIIERLPIKDLRSKSFLGLNRKEEFAYEISIRNTKNKPVNIIVEDQIPVSQDSEVEVELVDFTEAEVSDHSGTLFWKLNIPADKTQKVNYRYSVKYPKNKQVKGLR